jgi:uroporphyrinogen-III synthase
MKAGLHNNNHIRGSLHGVRVLVTRPAHQAASLVKAIDEAGGEAVCLPTIEIAAPTNPAALHAVLDRLHEFSWAIFISPNAVRQALPLVRRHGGIPSGLRLAAVGQGTLRALNEAGFDQVLAPAERFDSEALLDLLPPATVAGSDVLIFRGEGGRELLGGSLSARGARVVYAECYRRVPPRQPDATALARLREGGIDIVVLTSTEGARNLCDLVGETARARLLATPVVVIGERQAQACRELGFHAAVCVATPAGDAAILSALRAWRAGQISL